MEILTLVETSIPLVSAEYPSGGDLGFLTHLLLVLEGGIGNIAKCLSECVGCMLLKLEAMLAQREPGR